MKRLASLVLTLIFCLQIDPSSAQEKDSLKPNKLEQNTYAPCSRNITVITYSSGKDINQKGSDESKLQKPLISKTQAPECNINVKSTKLNRLEYAQLSLLVAQNPSGISVERVALFPVLGESTISLWAVLKNKYPLDAYNIRLKYKIDTKNTGEWSEKNRYMSSDLPSASIFGPVLKIPHEGEIFLKIIDSDEIIKFSPQPVNQWCIYDVHLEAFDSAVKGYGETNLAERESTVSLHSHTRTAAILFQLSFDDTFAIKHEIPVVAHLRFATNDSTYVFYPSVGKYDSLRCLNV